MTLTDNEVVEHMLAAEERCLLCSNLARNHPARPGGRSCEQFNRHPHRTTTGGATAYYSHARISDIACNRDDISGPGTTAEAALFCGRVLAQEPPCRLFSRAVPRENHDLAH